MLAIICAAAIGLASYLHDRSRKKNTLGLYQVDVQNKHAQNQKHLNSTKRNAKGRIRAIYYYWYKTYYYEKKMSDYFSSFEAPEISA